MNKQIERDRVVSFSYKPYDDEAYKAVTELKAYGSKRGITFSYLVLSAIKNHIKELNNEHTQG